MGEQDNLRMAREGWDAWNAHDVEGVVKQLDEKITWESDTLPAPIVGRDAYRQAMKMYLTAFPDLRFTVDRIFASGDVVVSQYTATGTHRGDLGGIAPTNRRGEIRGCTIVEYRNGKAIKVLGYWDSGRLLRQLGVLPS
jgi:steroid delta-isomerase-like uncharacterized protein